MNNTDIRQAAAQEGIKLWQIAGALGITDCTFSRKLRYELPESEKEKIFCIITTLSSKREVS